MTFTESVVTCFSKCATFSGRASRSEYWYFFLFCVLVGFVISIVMNCLLEPSERALFSLFLSLIFFLLSLAVQVRRLHDINLSGWFVLLSFIPFIGEFALFIINCIPGNPGSNRFGAVENSFVKDLSEEALRRDSEEIFNNSSGMAPCKNDFEGKLPEKNSLEVTERIPSNNNVKETSPEDIDEIFKRIRDRGQGENRLPEKENSPGDFFLEDTDRIPSNNIKGTFPEDLDVIFKRIRNRAQG